MDKLQRQIATLLEELVGKRFNEETLNHRLTDIFQWEVKVEDISDKEDELADYNFVFGFGDADSEFYVTEVNVDFE